MLVTPMRQTIVLCCMLMALCYPTALCCLTIYPLICDCLLLFAVPDSAVFCIPSCVWIASNCQVWWRTLTTECTTYNTHNIADPSSVYLELYSMPLPTVSTRYYQSQFASPFSPPTVTSHPDYTPDKKALCLPLSIVNFIIHVATYTAAAPNQKHATHAQRMQWKMEMPLTPGSIRKRVQSFGLERQIWGLLCG